jgi:hypothetical protein
MGASALVQNPALLAGVQGRAHLDFQVGIRQITEDRFVPLYDTFDEYVADTAYALNRHTYASGQGGLVVPLPGDRQGALAIGLFDRYDTDYDYQEEIRSSDPNDPVRDRIEQYNRFAADGRLRSVTLGYGREVLPSVSIGLAAHRYYGTLTTMREYLPVNDDPYRYRLDRDLSGWGYSVGAHLRAYDRLELGVSVEGPFTVSGAHRVFVDEGQGFVDSTSSDLGGDFEVKYPATVAFGFAYHPRNTLRTVFTAEARRRFWEKLDDEWRNAQDEAASLRNIWDFRMGVEHLFYNGMPARFGFRFVQNYDDRESDRTIFSAGTGYTFDMLRVDLTGQYTRQTSRQGFIFGNGASGVPNPPVRPKVEDSGLRFTLGVSRDW